MANQSFFLSVWNPKSVFNFFFSSLGQCIFFDTQQVLVYFATESNESSEISPIFLCSFNFRSSARRDVSNTFEQQLRSRRRLAKKMCPRHFFIKYYTLSSFLQESLDNRAKSWLAKKSNQGGEVWIKSLNCKETYVSILERAVLTPLLTKLQKEAIILSAADVEMQVTVLERSLKSSILSSTNFQMGKTFWGVMSAAAEQSRRRANMLRGTDNSTLGADPRITTK